MKLVSGVCTCYYTWQHLHFKLKEWRFKYTKNLILLETSIKKTSNVGYGLTNQNPTKTSNVMTTSIFAFFSLKMVKKVLKMQKICKISFKNNIKFSFSFHIGMTKRNPTKTSNVMTTSFFFAFFSPKMVKKVLKMQKIKKI